ELADRVRQRAENGKQVVLVTSDTAGSGKSTTATLLAQSLSRDCGLRTVLVDVNHGCPVLGDRLLGIDLPHGWESVVRGDQPLGEALFESKQESLVLLPQLNGGD